MNVKTLYKQFCQRVRSPRNEVKKTALKTYTIGVAAFSERVIQFISNLDVGKFFMGFLNVYSLEEDQHEQIEGYEGIYYLDEPEEIIE